VKGCIKFGCITVVVLLVIATVAGYFAYRALTHVPQWYVAALESEEVQQARGQQMEQQLKTLAIEVEQSNFWSAKFTAGELNGWLATHLKEEFPEWLPPGIDNPRVAIEGDRIRIGAQYTRSGVTTVVHTAAEVELTTEPNVVQVRIDKPQAGSIRLPLGQLMEEASKQAEGREIPLRWEETDDDPIAYITLPERSEEVDGLMIYEELEVRDGAIHVAGRTEKNY